MKLAGILSGLLLIATGSVAQIPNANYEAGPTGAWPTTPGGAIPGWTQISGNAWYHDNTVGPYGSGRGNVTGLWAVTLDEAAGPSNGEQNVGVLQSDIFTIPAVPLTRALAVDLGGYHDNGDANAFPFFCRVALHRASDNSIIGEALPPNEDPALTRYIVIPSNAAGQQAYIKLTDESNGGFAWMQADNWRFIQGRRVLETFEATARPNIPAGWNVISGGLWQVTHFQPNSFKSAREGKYYLHNGIEENTGVIESPPYTVEVGDLEFTFEQSGFDGDNPFDGNDPNINLIKVELFNATDVARAAPLASFPSPDQDPFVTRTFDVSAMTPGTQLVLRITDNAAGGFSWQGMDYIGFNTANPSSVSDWVLY